MINICNVQSLLLPPNIHAVSVHIVSSSPVTAAFVPLPYLFCQCHDMYFNQKEIIYGGLRIALVFGILTIASVISESLLGNTPVVMAILQCLEIFSP